MREGYHPGESKSPRRGPALTMRVLRVLPREILLGTVFGWPGYSALCVVPGTNASSALRWILYTSITSSPARGKTRNQYQRTDARWVFCLQMS
jgi:hypothetical protein